MHILVIRIQNTVVKRFPENFSVLVGSDTFCGALYKVLKLGTAKHNESHTTGTDINRLKQTDFKVKGHTKTNISAATSNPTL